MDAVSTHYVNTSLPERKKEFLDEHYMWPDDLAGPISWNLSMPGNCALLVETKLKQILGASLPHLSYRSLIPYSSKAMHGKTVDFTQTEVWAGKAEKDYRLSMALSTVPQTAS